MRKLWLALWFYTGTMYRFGKNMLECHGKTWRERIEDGAAAELEGRKYKNVKWENGKLVATK